MKSRSNDFELVSNQPVLSSSDPMHQIYLGVAKDLLPYHHNEMDQHPKAEISSYFESLGLPKEFIYTIRSLEILNIFKAKDAT